ncbi:hypothetical protein DSCA_31050 [Desulfosarcina alkanivorans]|uniref:Haem-binding uptake Tiki superfamily ChaN domain-containing protein n=1 Tax=Desulfosarcina alkanivorans TaxID=571177 RepID=A0A5K7YL82_9BACT|nr:ChaN family lipoprotein [Desulfosarcina alkanivorans]BBO69175.1 hypothetical protein DSCA_31050 [Desulfosarcina alkanivorans]
MTRHLFRSIMALSTLTVILLAGGCRGPAKTGPLNLYDLETRQPISGPHAVAKLKHSRLVLVGEHHTNPAHHTAQLRVIRALNAQSAPLSIGLEMFRKDSQNALDRWVAGELTEKDFKKTYLDNWNFPWPLYREIFIYARDEKIPMVGLNVSRGITRQVARQGFASLSESQREELEGVSCNVTREYRDFIRSAFGAHGHGSMDFIHFCEAQLVWDTAMAINAVHHLEKHPDRVMVLLAGSGHARKMGIPYQVGNRSPMPLTVLLPHTPDIFDPDSLTRADADFIIIP